LGVGAGTGTLEVKGIVLGLYALSSLVKFSGSEFAVSLFRISSGVLNSISVCSGVKI
jgi:hypothetical protein